MAGNFDDIIKQAMADYAQKQGLIAPRTQQMADIMNWLDKFNTPQMNESDLPPDTANEIQQSYRDKYLDQPLYEGAGPPKVVPLPAPIWLDFDFSGSGDRNI